MKKFQEYEDAKLLAQQILDRTDEDPDSTEMMLSRQFLRQVETVNRLNKKLNDAHYPHGDFVNATRKLKAIHHFLGNPLDGIRFAEFEETISPLEPQEQYDLLRALAATLTLPRDADRERDVISRTIYWLRDELLAKLEGATCPTKGKPQ